MEYVKELFVVFHIDEHDNWHMMLDKRSHPDVTELKETEDSEEFSKGNLGYFRCGLYRKAERERLNGLLEMSVPLVSQETMVLKLAIL